MAEIIRRRFRRVTRARIPTQETRGLTPNLRERNEKAVQDIGGVYDKDRALRDYDELIAKGRPKKS